MRRATRLSFLGNLRSPYFPPSSTLTSIVAFTAPLHSSSPGHGPFPRTRGYPFSTLTLVPHHFTSDHPSLHSRRVTHNHSHPQSLIITQKCPPFPQDSRSPLFNYRSRYFPSLHLNSCWTSSLTYPSTCAYLPGWFHPPLSLEIMLSHCRWDAGWHCLPMPT